MQTIIPISVEEASTEVLAKISERITGRFNCTLQIDLYQGRGSDFANGPSTRPPFAGEIEEIFSLLGKSGQPHFIISMRPNGAP